jgi:hypothetical protein
MKSNRDLVENYCESWDQLVLPNTNRLLAAFLLTQLRQKTGKTALNTGQNKNMLNQ